MANSIYEDGAIDFARPPKEIIFERFNAINGTNFNHEDFLLTEVEVMIDPRFNTEVKAVPINTSQWSKGFPIRYSRIPISEQMQFVAEVPTNGETNLYGILDAINTAYGIYLTEADVQDALINYTDPGDTSGSGNVQLIARSTSLFFTSTITIPINNTVAYGVSVYDDELVHFLAVRDSGFDRVIGKDALGQTLDSFTFGKEATWTSSNIRQLFKKSDGTLIVIGDFNYTLPPGHPVGNGARTDKVLFLTSRGDISNATAGSLFGLNFNGLKYIEAFDQQRVYAIDVLGTVGGNVHGLLCFTEAGDVDVTFTPALTKKVTAVAVYEDKIYIGSEDGQDAILKRLNADGSIDATFPQLAVKMPAGRPQDHGRIVSIHATTRGIALLVKPNTETGTIPWVEFSKVPPAAGMSPPVIVVSHEGVVESAFSKPHPLFTGYRSGVAVDGGIIALTTQAAVYLANGCDLSTGNLGIIPISVDQEGIITGSFNTATKDDYPFFTSFISVQLSTRGDVIVSGNAYLMVGNEPKQFTVVVAYDFEGNFAARLLTIADKRLIAYQHHRYMQT